MIASLRGTIVSKDPSSVLIEVSGVGYEVSIPLSTFEALPPRGDETHLLTHLHVRENQMALYGFATEPERKLFRLLQDVNRVGPSSALQILSDCSVTRFKKYVAAEDTKTLSNMVKGIGKKTARRLVMELKPEIDRIPTGPDDTVPDSAEEAVRALMELGSPRADAQEAINEASKALGPDAGPDQLVRQAMSGREEDE